MLLLLLVTTCVVISYGSNSRLLHRKFNISPFKVRKIFIQKVCYMPITFLGAFPCPFISFLQHSAVEIILLTLKIRKVLLGMLRYFIILIKLGETVSDGDGWEVENGDRSELIWLWMWYCFLHTILSLDHITDFPLIFSSSTITTMEAEISFLTCSKDHTAGCSDSKQMVFPLCSVTCSM